MSQVEGTIFDIRKFSLFDGPGIRTTVFFKGCPLTCQWCHNPESQSFQDDIMLWEQRCIGCGECISHCAQQAIVKIVGIDGRSRVLTNRNRCTRCGECIDACAADARERVGRRVSVQEIMREIERDRAFYEESGGGVTFSGGEPMAQINFLRELLLACRQKDLHTAVDTSGYAAWSAFESILPLTDLFLYDVKIMDDTLHRRYTGVSNEIILRNLQSLAQRGARIIARIPIVPGINDNSDNLERFAAFASSLPALERVDILPYHPSAAGKYERLGMQYALNTINTPSTGDMEAIARVLQSHELPVKIGG